ncbi:hypothetical protein ES705_04938 [subsurface metagenome]
MNNLETSQKAIDRAFRWYQGAIRAYEDERWDDSIYTFQMSVEQSLKGILILYGIEYPKKHDISNVYILLKEKDVPEWFKNKINSQIKILKNLIKLKGISAYGYIDGITKEHFKDDAIKFKKPVEDIITTCKALIVEFSRNIS